MFLLKTSTPPSYPQVPDIHFPLKTFIRKQKSLITYSVIISILMFYLKNMKSLIFLENKIVRHFEIVLIHEDNFD